MPCRRWLSIRLIVRRCKIFSALAQLAVQKRLEGTEIYSLYCSMGALGRLTIRFYWASSSSSMLLTSDEKRGGTTELLMSRQKLGVLICGGVLFSVCVLGWVFEIWRFSALRLKGLKETEVRKLLGEPEFSGTSLPASTSTPGVHVLEYSDFLGRRIGLTFDREGNVEQISDMPSGL